MRVSELRAALEDALGPIYRVEREVRPVGDCRLFVAVGPPNDPELLVKVLPAERRKNGGAAGPRDDMFAVGVLLHEMLTGELPAVEAEALEEVRSLPPWLAELARRCLTAEPTGRWPDAAAALDAVGRSGAGPM